MTHKTLFLIDGTGALFTALFLGVIMTTFESSFGMPRNVLYLLSAIAVVYGIYSFRCYFKKPQNWRPFLKGIAFANLAYCCLTGVLVVVFFERLTVLAIAYFVVEILIIVSLASAELVHVKQTVEEMR